MCIGVLTDFLRLYKIMTSTTEIINKIIFCYNVCDQKITASNPQLGGSNWDRTLKATLPFSSWLMSNDILAPAKNDDCLLPCAGLEVDEGTYTLHYGDISRYLYDSRFTGRAVSIVLLYWKFCLRCCIFSCLLPRCWLCCIIQTCSLLILYTSLHCIGR